MQFVQFLFWFLYFFVKFTKFSHHVHNLFIICWYTLNTVKEEIRLPDNKAYKINFFIIAQAPKGVWALLILWGFSCHPITVLTIKKNLACEILRLRRVAFATYFITAAVRSLRSILYDRRIFLSYKTKGPHIACDPLVLLHSILSYPASLPSYAIPAPRI